MSQELEIIEDSQFIEDSEEECEGDPFVIIRDFTDQEKADAQRLSDELYAEFREPTLRALAQRSFRERSQNELYAEFRDPTLIAIAQRAFCVRDQIKRAITDFTMDSLTPEINDRYKDRNIVKTLILVNQPYLEYCYAPEPDDGNDLLYAMVTLTTCNELNIIDFEDKIVNDFLGQNN